jgi:hypothetical protein
MDSKLQKLAQMMQSDLEWYFTNAGEDSKTNVTLFRKQIDTYKAEILPLGFAQIAIMLREFPGERRQEFERQGLANSLPELCVTFGLEWIRVWADIVATFGVEGIDRIVEVTQVYSEDTASLAALMLSLPPFWQNAPEYTVRGLITAFERAEGTGLRLALGYLLSEFGIRQPLIELGDKYMLPRGKVFLFANVIKQRKPDASQDEVDAYMCDYVMEQGEVLPTIILDVATSGKAPRDIIPNWVQAKKNKLA